MITAEGSTLRIRDVTSCETIAVFDLDAPLTTVAVTADARKIAVGDRTGGVHFLDLDLSRKQRIPS
ncbi:MAG: hypothetical protein GY723_01890 [bacterium]|nr:hypothetical protein [bacterium]